jgi:AcrR family transcriptional regulator
MARNTKEKILVASIDLFNELGLANVRLQHIADKVGISVGNLSYHFKTKDAIISRVYEDLFAEFSTILSLYLQHPDWKDFDYQLSQYYRFFSKYRFHLADLLFATNHPSTTLDTWNRYANKLLAQIRHRISFYVERQLLQPEPQPGIYDQVAKNIWRTIFFSIPEAVFRGETPSEQRFCNNVWKQLTPYFTTEGQSAFAQFSQQRRLN